MKKKIVFALMCLLLSGCGGNDNTNFVVTGNQVAAGAGNQAQVNSFVGRFFGVSSLVPGQIARVDVNVASDGEMTGNFVVNVPGVTSQAVSFVTSGTYPVNGSVNPNNGAFTLDGTFPQFGPFSISGTLPLGTNVGTYSLTFNGETYSGVVQNSSLGLPGVPDTGGGGNGPVDGTYEVRNGTLWNFVFSPTPTYNGVNPPVDPSFVLDGSSISVGGRSNFIVLRLLERAGADASPQFRALALNISPGLDVPLEIGRAYPVTGGSGMTYGEFIASSPDKLWSQSLLPSDPTTGSATVTQLTNSSVTLEFSFQNIAPAPSLSPHNGTGKFDISGTISGTLVRTP